MVMYAAIELQVTDSKSVCWEVFTVMKIETVEFFLSE